MMSARTVILLQYCRLSRDTTNYDEDDDDEQDSTLEKNLGGQLAPKF